MRIQTIVMIIMKTEILGEAFSKTKKELGLEICILDRGTLKWEKTQSSWIQIFTQYLMVIKETQVSL